VCFVVTNFSPTSRFPVAVLAGGLATRLRPITEKIPKLLVEVAGEPFFSHQLRLLKQNGLTDIVLCVGHLGQQIVDLYGDGSKFGVSIKYSFDGERLLGTAGALRRALHLLGDAFYILYGDSYLPIDYRAVGQAFATSGLPALMTVFENRGRFDASNVWFEDGKIRLYDKRHPTPVMQHIDYGLGVIRSSALAALPADTVIDLADVYHEFSTRDQLAGFEVNHRFYEIGSHSGITELAEHLRLYSGKVGKPYT
jgi:NDP-sugar pyrophosphorylase family protein